MAQVACEFADLHDRAGRMKAVGAVRESALEMEGGGKPMEYRIVPVCWFGLVFIYYKKIFSTCVVLEMDDILW